MLLGDEYASKSRCELLLHLLMSETYTKKLSLSLWLSRPWDASLLIFSFPSSHSALILGAYFSSSIWTEQQKANYFYPFDSKIRHASFGIFPSAGYQDGSAYELLCNWYARLLHFYYTSSALERIIKTRRTWAPMIRPSLQRQTTISECLI